MHRLSCAFVVHIWHKQVFSWRGSYNPGSEQQRRWSDWMHRLSCAFVVHICHKQVFSWRGSIRLWWPCSYFQHHRRHRNIETWPKLAKWWIKTKLRLSPVKRICDFEHSVMTNFNCACPAIQRGQGSGFLSESSSWLTACKSEQRRFWRDCADAQARLNLRCSHRL